MHHGSTTIPHDGVQVVLAGQELGRLIVYRGLVSDHEKYGLMMTGDTSTAEGPSLDPCLYSLAFCLAVHIFYKQGNKFNRPSDPSFFFSSFSPLVFGVVSEVVRRWTNLVSPTSWPSSHRKSTQRTSVIFADTCLLQQEGP